MCPAGPQGSHRCPCERGRDLGWHTEGMHKGHPSACGPALPPPGEGAPRRERRRAFPARPLAGGRCPCPSLLGAVCSGDPRWKGA